MVSDRILTESALQKIIDTICTNIGSAMISLLEICDLSKAFEGINHKILLNKCAKLNVDSLWLNSYLANKTQSVSISIISRTANVQFGVP